MHDVFNKNLSTASFKELEFNENNNNDYDPFKDLKTPDKNFDPFKELETHIKNYDPFGLSVTELNSTHSQNLTSDFGFEGDFANFDAFNNNSNDNSFMNNKQKDAPIYNEKKEKDRKASKISKYSTDYSENYDKDLNEILKRSIIEH